MLSGIFQYFFSFCIIYWKGLGIGAEMLKRLSQVCITVTIVILYVILFFIKCYYLTLHRYFILTSEHNLKRHLIFFQFCWKLRRGKNSCIMHCCERKTLNFSLLDILICTHLIHNYYNLTAFITLSNERFSDWLHYLVWACHIIYQFIWSVFY